MTNSIRDQFMADMQVAGLAESSSKQYLNCINAFFRETWLAPDAVTERDVQQYLLWLRDKDVARETFRGVRFALGFFFEQTLRRDWDLFKKKFKRPRKAVLP